MLFWPSNYLLFPFFFDKKSICVWKFLLLHWCYWYCYSDSFARCHKITKITVFRLRKCQLRYERIIQLQLWFVTACATLSWIVKSSDIFAAAFQTIWHVFRIDSECFATSFSSKQDILIFFFYLTDFDIGEFKLSAYFYVRLAFRICQSVFLKHCKSCNPKSLSFQLNIAAKNNWFVAWHAWEIENERIFCWV